MIIDAYIQHLKDTLGVAIENNISDATYSFHSEFYYNDSADINCTIKMLPGQIELGIVQYPIQIMIECKDKFKEDLMPVLDDFAKYYNEGLISLDSEDYREYYTTSTVVGTFQNDGINRKVALTMDATLICFDDVARVKEIVLTYGANSTDVISIKHLDFAFSFEAETNSTGAMNAPETKSVTKSMARSLNFAFVPLSSVGMDDLLSSIVNRSTTKTYKLKVSFKSSTTTDIVYEEFVELKSGAYASQLKGFPVVRVVFVKSMRSVIG